jgi:hypothetical protein
MRGAMRGSMKHTAGLSIALAAMWILSACASLEPRAKEDLSEGYALLYELVSKSARFGSAWDVP